MLQYEVKLFGETIKTELKSNDPLEAKEMVDTIVTQKMFREHGLKSYSKLMVGKTYDDVKEPDIKLNVDIQYTGRRYSILNNLGTEVDTVILIISLVNTSISNTSEKSKKDGSRDRVISYDIKTYKINSVEDIYEARELGFKEVIKRYSQYRRGPALMAA